MKLSKFSPVLFSALFIVSCNGTKFAFSETNQAMWGADGLVVRPATLDFGNVLLKNESAAQITIINGSKKKYSLSFDKPGASAFRMDSSRCAVLNPDDICTVDVKFRPSQATEYKDQPNVKVSVVDAASSESQNSTNSLNFLGKGLLIPPSPLDRLTLVGWYSYKQPQKISMDNANPAFSKCKAIGPGNMFNPKDYGRPEEYCYEPSGANGMSLPGSNFSDLTSYILQAGYNFNSVATLDELFSKPDDLKSDNVCWKEALFYYALSYLMIPRNYNLADPRNDIFFELSNVDDGIQLISNSDISGRFNLGESGRISLHRGQQGNLSSLNHGANTIVALWIDDCAGGRLIKDARMTDVNGSLIPQALPNVLNGYIYSKLDGVSVRNADVKIKDSAGNEIQAQMTDAAGFYQFENLPNGTLTMEIYSQGALAETRSVDLDHRSAKTAAVNLSVGI